MIATSINQSKSLIESGLSADTADMYWEYDSLQKFHRLELFEDGFLKTLNKDDIPAWSLSALIELMPSSTLDISNDHWGRIRCSERFTNWCMSPVDAAFEMVCYLLENKLIE